MKTTLDLHDELLVRAKCYAKRAGKPLRAVVEEGLRRVLSESRREAPYSLPDLSVGQRDAPDPLEAFSWQDLRARIYAEPDGR